MSEGVRWADLARIEIRTLSTGPLDDDALWLLEATDGSGVVIPSEAAPDGFLERIQALPGFDNAAVITAMTSTDDAVFRCWTRPPG